MSRFKKLWVLIAPMAVMLVLGTGSPAQADNSAPPPPTKNDPCGVSQDQVYTPNGQPLQDVSWRDTAGNRYGAGMWQSTGGAASITLIATVNGTTEYTYPPLTFGTEPDSSCVEAPDTVSTRVVSCNTSNGGTVVEFTYTNTDDATNLAHTRPAMLVDRWDHEDYGNVVWTEGQVADGSSLSVTGGDAVVYSAQPNQFFLAPGTYTMTLTTNETGSRVLPNRLFVPGCGIYKVPPGDPMGGPTPTRTSQPRAAISRCRAHVVRVALDARQATSQTRYKLVVNPKRGRTIKRYYSVSAATLKVIKLRRQKSGTVVKVVFNGTVVKRKLKC